MVTLSPVSRGAVGQTLLTRADSAADLALTPPLECGTQCQYYIVTRRGELVVPASLQTQEDQSCRKPP